MPCQTSALRDPDLHGRRVVGSLLTTFLAAAILLVVGMPRTASAQGTGATPAATPVPANACDEVAPGVGAEARIRTELYFGTIEPDGTDVTPGEWREFLEDEITPRFPDGLTILEGYGQFLDREGVMLSQDTIVMIVFYPATEVDEASAHFEEIRAAYEQRFQQEAVLRVDSHPVCVSF